MANNLVVLVEPDNPRPVFLPTEVQVSTNDDIGTVFGEFGRSLNMIPQGYETTHYMSSQFF